jgi:acyl-CoA reductase-like NAD-dependent aldehyde dehydrogenase
MISAAQRRTSLEYIDVGIDAGAERVTGGQVPKGAGFYLTPTVLAGVDNSMRVAREEIFGPGASIIPFRDEADAVRIANDSEFGLAAGVWTKDIDVALRTTKALRAGTVWVNAYHDAGLAFVMPFGGYKTSGFGRELGREGLDEYFETKAVHIKLGRAS